MDSLKSTYFIAVRTFQTLSDILGLILFGALFLITIKHRKLHSICHLLIGIFSLFILFSKLGTLLPYLFYMIPDLYLIFANIGLWLQFLLISLRSGIHPMMFLIGVDRLLSVLFPIWYKTRESIFYLSFMLSIPATFIIYVTVIAAIDIQTQTNVEIFMAGFNDRNPIIIKCLICFVVLTFFCYLLMFIKILCVQNGNSSIRQAIFKSLGLIMLIQIGGWLINFVGQRMVANLELKLEQKTFIINCLSSFISLATNLEVILLYYTSSDHRKALKKTFGWLFCTKLNNSTISIAVPNGIKINLDSQQNILCTTKI